jgi:hypothetical protein
MVRFTMALRQKIVEEFAEKNGGWFDPAAFLESVRRAGTKHPAFVWFEWDDDKAAHEFRLDQARDFARGLVIRFEVRTQHRGAFRIVEQSAPLIMSPIAGRKDGGGYFVTDPNDPAHMAELCRQAAQSLRWFVSRYEAALRFAGVSLTPIERAQSALEAFDEKDEAA